MTLKQPRILLIYTGGTIGMMRSPETGVLRAFDFENLLTRIPELQALGCCIETKSFDVPIDSSNINPSHWITIAEVIENNYDNFDGFVVLHGSDTMSYTASALSFMLENLRKPVIFTGSQLPIGHLRTDAKENLITSIHIASLQYKGEPSIQEVGLYFEYKLYRGNRTTKIKAQQFEAFASFNFPHLVESGVHLHVDRSRLIRTAPDSKFRVHKVLNKNITLVKLFPGLSKEAIESMFNAPRLEGIVLETYGAGNCPTDAWFLELLKQTVDRGVHIVNVTQCAGGSVIFGLYETSAQLKSIGLISGKDITTEAALSKLMYLLGREVPRKEFKKLFEKPLRGEIS